MDLTAALLDSWDRQCRIVEAVSTLVDEGNRHVKPSEDGWPLDRQLSHVHGTRRFWLSQVAPHHAEKLASTSADDQGTPIADLEQIKKCLRESGAAIRAAVEEGINNGGGPLTGKHATYDNPILLLQHMVWHEGWHVGLIMLALRLNGQEPGEEWEEPNVWGQWRTESW